MELLSWVDLFDETTSHSNHTNADLVCKVTVPHICGAILLDSFTYLHSFSIRGLQWSEASVVETGLLFVSLVISNEISSRLGMALESKLSDPTY